ncbi:hypothetical protein TNCV_2025811 [Trichonephila clavipes]|nr:hypothetical protein TNCV_2025811 [Trichonephila clavipes]
MTYAQSVKEERAATDKRVLETVNGEEIMLQQMVCFWCCMFSEEWQTKVDESVEVGIPPRPQVKKTLIHQFLLFPVLKGAFSECNFQNSAAVEQTVRQFLVTHDIG